MCLVIVCAMARAFKSRRTPGSACRWLSSVAA
ncbi:MAG: PilI type IV pilus biogenesis protein [Pyrinomonadaceae bacterium]|nr:PilI type IV pilus biogenesis protein [Pyrinomonadaceae bacterium]